MKNELSELSEDVQEANLTALIVAQRVLVQDFEVGKLRLGVSDEMAKVILGLSPLQINQMVRQSTPLCVPRINNAALKEALESHAMRKGMASLQIANTVVTSPGKKLAA